MPRARAKLSLGKKKGNKNRQQVLAKEAREAAARAGEEAEAKAYADARREASAACKRQLRERRRQSREAPAAAAAPSADSEWETDCDENVPEEDQGAPGPSVQPQTKGSAQAPALPRESQGQRACEPEMSPLVRIWRANSSYPYSL